MNWLGAAPLAELAHQIAHAKGPSGSNNEYLFRLAETMRKVACRRLSICVAHVCSSQPVVHIELAIVLPRLVAQTTDHPAARCSAINNFISVVPVCRWRSTTQSCLSSRLQCERSATPTTRNSMWRTARFSELPE